MLKSFAELSLLMSAGDRSLPIGFIIVSKQRLGMFTKQFSLGKKKSAKNIMNKANPSSYDHLIEDSNSLVSDDDDDHLAEGTSHVRLEKKNSQI